LAGSAYYWWLRGANYNNSNNVCNVNSSGGANNNNYNNANGLAPAGLDESFFCSCCRPRAGDKDD
jgi:hypothetical protein